MSTSAIERVVPLVGHLPPSARDALMRSLRRLTGLGLIALSGLATAALITWSVQDPSLSQANSRSIHNVLGYAGAIGADLSMQILGLGAIMLILPLAVLGWRMLTNRPFDREALRIGSWVLCMASMAGFASSFPHGGAWPLPTGLGGVVGDALIRAPAVIFGPPGVMFSLLFALILFTVMALTFLIACGLGARERSEEAAQIEDEDAALDEEEGSNFGSVSLGWLFHAVMSTKARLGWLFGTAYRSLVSSAPQARALSFDRHEPSLGGRAAPSIAPTSEDEDFEEEEEEEEEEAPAAPPPRKKAASRTPARKTPDKFEFPTLSLLAAPKAADRKPPGKTELEATSRALEGVLQDFGVRGEIVNAHPGPVVTLYDLEPAPGIKSSRVIGLAEDIARSMSAEKARIAVVPGRNVIGIELPNAHREKVYLRELLTTKEAIETVAKLPLCLGKTIGGDPVVIDLARTPHMLVAGRTGSGKSVAINTMILSLVYRLRPDQCRLIMVDPKMIELSVYEGIPHLLTPVVTDPKKAVVALKWAVREMEERYKNMAKLGVRNIDGYNARLAEAKAKGEEPTRTVHTGFDKETGTAIYEEEKLSLDPLPYIVIIVDEMADLMQVAGKDIEGAVQRLAQMARAAGLHVILATQRPSVDVITGTIKANFPTRIAFAVASKIDSRTILGEMGAEQLLGNGDMLYMEGGGRIRRVHGPFASEDEVEKVVRHLKTQGQPEYLEAVTAEEAPADEDGAVFDATGMGGDGGGDLFTQAVAIVKRDRKASTSYIQRRLQIGYNRAASLMERMEQEGIVGPANHAGKREILVEEEDSPM